MKFDWTTGFSLDIDAYHVEQHSDKVELTIPVLNVDKKDVKIQRDLKGGRNILNVSIPDTVLSKHRDLAFYVDEEYDLTKVKANVRDGVLFIHIPLKEKSKPTYIEIT